MGAQSTEQSRSSQTKNYKRRQIGRKRQIEQIQLLHRLNQKCRFISIVDLFQLFERGFKEENFQKGIRSSFVKTGTLTTRTNESDDYNFVEYNTHSMTGTMKSVIPLGTKAIDTQLAPQDNDILLEDAINIYLDAEDDVDDSDLNEM